MAASAYNFLTARASTVNYFLSCIQTPSFKSSSPSNRLRSSTVFGAIQYMNERNGEFLSSASSSDSDCSTSNERPRKRARTSQEASALRRRVVLQELDVEIALQERIARTVESRITWALLLQQAVQSDLTGAPVFHSRRDFLLTRWHQDRNMPPVCRMLL